MAASFAVSLKVGTVVLLEGPLGAGKTTFVRGALAGLGFNGTVKSPTFNLIQLYDSSPPVMHADLYRLQNASGIGLEAYLESHLCFIEWPDRLMGLVDPREAWVVKIEFSDDLRKLTIQPPSVPS